MCSGLSRKLGSCSSLGRVIFFVALLQMAFSESVCYSDSDEYFKKSSHLSHSGSLKYAARWNLKTPLCPHSTVVYAYVCLPILRFTRDCYAEHL